MLPSVLWCPAGEEGGTARVQGQCLASDFPAQGRPKAERGKQSHGEQRASGESFSTPSLPDLVYFSEMSFYVPSKST